MRLFQSIEPEKTEADTSNEDMAGYDPYVIWLCKQFTTPVTPAEAEPNQ